MRTDVAKRLPAIDSRRLFAGLRVFAKENGASKLVRRIRMKFNGIPDLDGLVRRGLRLGRGVQAMEGVNIDHAHCWLVEIGDDTTIAPNVHIIAHDASTKVHIGYTRIARVCIGRRVFLGAGSIILPGVSIGDDAIVAAGSVVTRDVAAGTIVGGNPARQIGSTREYVERNVQLLASRPRFPFEGWTQSGGITSERRLEQWDALVRPGFVE